MFGRIDRIYAGFWRFSEVTRTTDPEPLLTQTVTWITIKQTHKPA